MASAPSRSRRRSSPTTRDRGAVGDLFAHFGVEAEAPAELPTAIIAAAACSRCGWLCREDEPARTCPLCAGPLGRKDEAC